MVCWLSLLRGWCGFFGEGEGETVLIDFIQHCLLKWIDQEASKKQCPMCRQSNDPSCLLGGTADGFAEFEWKQSDA